MRFQLDLLPVLAIMLAATRIGLLFVASPLFSSMTRMNSIKVLLTLALTAPLMLSLNLPLPKLSLNPGDLLLALAQEVVLGVTLAFSLHVAFAVFAMAGKIIDVQAGFALGSVFDPVTRLGAPIFSSLLNMLALLIFFTLDGHHALLRGIVFSLQQVPPGTGLHELPLTAVVRQFGLMFSLALSLIAPVMFTLFLVEAAMAMVSRVLPQMNILVIGVTVKIGVALALLALTIATMLPVMNRIFASIFSFWEQVL